MNIEALRSFLSVAECGSFSMAAARLGVTQSTISVRIRTLEEDLGRSLFNRGRHGAELTTAGQDLRRHGSQIVQAWDQARQQLALPEGFHGLLGIGGPVGLYDPMLMRWVQWMGEHAPGTAVRLAAGYSEVLSDQLATGLLDVAFMYHPRRRPGLKVEVLFNEQLVLVAHPNAAQDWQSRYAYVDWSQEFRANHARALRDLPSSGVTIGLGMLGLQYVFTLRGAAYLPLRTVAPYLASGELVQIETTPVFRQPVFLAHPSQPSDPALLEQAVAGLREIIEET